MKIFVFAGVLLLFWSCEIEAQACGTNGNFCAFHSLTLSENQVLSNVSPDTRTKELEFTGSNLHSIPGEIFSFFENMERLEMKSQKIQTIKDETFTAAKSLTYLNLNENEIKGLRENSFEGCAKLEELYVESNQLRDMEEGAFNGATNLKRLSLSNNQIAHINENLLEPLVNLETISFYQNRIEFLSETVFKYNSKLSSIDLDKNQLNSLSYKTFSKLTNLGSLDLNKNECVAARWTSRAFQSMNLIKEYLKECEKRYMVEAPLKKISVKLETMDVKIGNLETSLNAIDAKFEEKFSKILQLLQSQDKNREKIEETATDGGPHV